MRLSALLIMLFSGNSPGNKTLNPENYKLKQHEPNLSDKTRPGIFWPEKL